MLASGTEKGIDWIVYEGPMGSPNGYVQLPEGHSWIKSRPYLMDLPYDERPDVHGGVTYGPDDDRWIGFDTSHFGDEIAGIRSGRHWTTDAVASEAKRLAVQVKEAETV